MTQIEIDPLNQRTLVQVCQVAPSLEQGYLYGSASLENDPI
jgi:hypothetical protein